MRDKKSSIGLRAASAALAVTLLATSAYAATEKVLYSFKENGTDGVGPNTSLILDAAGNLYGTTSGGGTSNEGTVFELAPTTNGWTETILFSFDGTNGAIPNAGLILDAAGNLYGTTSVGGASDDGIVFELTPTASGWTETILFSFDRTDGDTPNGTLVFDSKGNLYGTTVGGPHGGLVFELTPVAGGGWTETVLHSFWINGIHRKDGDGLNGGLVLDANGNVYGTTVLGGYLNYCQNYGFDGCGVVFELTPGANGSWTETVPHKFTGAYGKFKIKDGANPFAGLIIDAAGNLYGTTKWEELSVVGGTVFELMPKAGGGWKEKILRTFGGDNGRGGFFLFGALLLDASGNLYGTTQDGGAYNVGTAFKLTPTTVGPWKETILHSFHRNGTDGYEPVGSLIMDISGNLYGTTPLGGTGACTVGGERVGCGAVFEITP